MAATCASYFPNEAETQQFWERELQREKSILDVPAGFPKRLSAPQVWTADEIVTQKDKWIVSLSEGEVTSIDAALSAFEGWYRLRRRGAFAKKDVLSGTR